MKVYRVESQYANIEVTGGPGLGGSITSNLSKSIHRKHANPIDSLILALACEGVDVGTEAFGRALDTTLEAISNSY